MLQLLLLRSQLLYVDAQLNNVTTPKERKILRDDLKYHLFIKILCQYFCMKR